MQKLVLVLLAFLAVFTLIRTIEGAGASENTAEISSEITVEIDR